MFDMRKLMGSYSKNFLISHFYLLAHFIFVYYAFFNRVNHLTAKDNSCGRADTCCIGCKFSIHALINFYFKIHIKLLGEPYNFIPQWTLLHVFHARQSVYREVRLNCNSDKEHNKHYPCYKRENFLLIVSHQIQC